MQNIGTLFIAPHLDISFTLNKGMPISCGPAIVVNSVEVPYFDLKEDPLFWMEHNVQVRFIWSTIALHIVF